MIFLYLWGAVIAAIVLLAIVLRIIGLPRKRLPAGASDEERLIQAWKEARDRASWCWVLALILAILMAVTCKWDVGRWQDLLWPFTLVLMIIAGFLTTFAGGKCRAVAEPTSERADAAMEKARMIGAAVGEKTWKWVLLVGENPQAWFFLSIFLVWTISSMFGIVTACAIGLTSVWTARVRSFKGRG